MRFARLGPANAKGRAMAKRIIRQLTTSNFDFPALVRSKTKKYVDKTGLLYELSLDTEESQYFLSRPRRFGKSLMLSTLQAMFEGRRELFKGLKIDALPWECWDKKSRYPVYNFSMTDVEGESYPKVRAALEKLTKRLCDAVELPYDPEVDASINFGEFIKAAAAKSPTKKRAVSGTKIVREG